VIRGPVRKLFRTCQFETYALERVRQLSHMSRPSISDSFATTRLRLKRPPLAGELARVP
jgi:hypothetical protein